MSILKSLTKTSVIAALTIASISAVAEKIKLTADLKGSSEVPAHDVPGTGKVEATFDTASNEFTYHIIYSGLTGGATAAHFHGPAAEGANAKPSLPVKQDPLQSPLDGKATLTQEQSKDLLDGKWYFNVHTAANPGGEIRGQLLKLK